MNIKIFFLEQWRMGLAFLLALCFMMLVVELDLVGLHVQVPWSDILYAGLLGLFFFCVYLVAEYWIRRPFYQALAERLQTEANLEEISTFTKGCTYEQRLFLELLHKYHRQFMKERIKLEESYKFYEWFVNRFAHQMKTPITVLQLLEGELKEQLERLETEVPSLQTEVNACKTALHSMQVERDRLNQSVHLMLHTARLTSFQFDAHMETFDCLGLLRSIVNAYKSQWVHFSLYPRIESERERVEVRSDQKWFHFMCDQIVRNALQYGHTETSAEFVIRVQVYDDRTEIQFCDRGIGIPARDLPHVFKPFYTGVNGRMHSRATGMGLYLVKQVADRLGHQVSIQSTEGKGTTVTFTIWRPEYYHGALKEETAI
jgi:OmpR family two-component system sensor histidine kinase YxdK